MCESDISSLLPVTIGHATSSPHLVVEDPTNHFRLTPLTLKPHDSNPVLVLKIDQVDTYLGTIDPTGGGVADHIEK